MHADGQQAFALLHHFVRRTCIDADGAAQLQVVGHPLFAGLLLVRGGDQQGADAFALGQAQQRIGLTPPSNHGAGTRARRPFGRQDFGEHAAAPNAGAGPTCHQFELRVTGLARGDEMGAGVFARVGAEQAFLVGQDDQRIGFHQIGHQGTQGVVIAKFDFIVHHRVILVDDRQHAMRQQGVQGRAGVQVALSVGQIGVGQQDLRAAQAVFAQLGFVHVHQTHLAHGSGSLQLMHFMRAGGPAQAFHAFGDGAAGDHDDFALRLGGHQHGDLSAPFANGHIVQPPAFVGDQAGAHLDHDATGVAQNRVVFRHGRARACRREPRQNADRALLPPGWI